MQTHQERVVDEKTELDKKHRALQSFMQGPVFKTLPLAEQLRLNRQSRVMDDYSGILAERIEDFQNI